MSKKKFKDTKFGIFLNKAKDALPEIASVGLSIASGNVIGAVSKARNILKKGAEKDEKVRELLIEFEMFKMDFERECFELEAEDRKDARNLYSNDSLIQKIFAIIFLIGYGALSWYLLHVIIGNIEIPKLAETMITMIWTGTSTKLNTIIDFFFGGSVKQEK